MMRKRINKKSNQASGNDCFLLNHDGLNDSNWKAIVSQRGLKIVLKKIDEHYSVKDYKSRKISSIQTTDCSFLSPNISIPRIDCLVPRNVKDEESRQFHASCSTSIITSPEMQQTITTQNILAINSTSIRLAKDEENSYPKSRKVLKDVKNTSELSLSISRDSRTNIFYESIQSKLEGQENLPVTSNCAVKPFFLPQVCVKLTQLNTNLYPNYLIGKKYFETMSTMNSVRENLNSHFKSVTVHNVSGETLQENSSELFVRSFTQTINETEILGKAKQPRISNIEPSQRPSVNGRKRKYRKRKYGYQSLPKSFGRTSGKKNVCSSSVVGVKTGEDNSNKFYQSHPKQKGRDVLSMKESQTMFENGIDEKRANGTEIFRREAALEFHASSFANSGKESNDCRNSSNAVKETEVRLNISSTKTVRQDDTQVDECVEFSYSSVKKKDPSNSMGKRKLDPDNSFICDAPKKRSVNCSYSYSEFERSSDGKENHIMCNYSTNNGAKNVFQSVLNGKNAVCRSSQNEGVVIIERTKTRKRTKSTNTKPSKSYLTRNKVAENKESVEFCRIPWKKQKGLEIIPPKPEKSTVIAEVDTASKKKQSAKIEMETSNTLDCYKTRRKTAQSGESVNFYRIPWNRAKGFEIVEINSKKLAKIENSNDSSEPPFKGWPVQKNNPSVVLPSLRLSEEEDSTTKKGILKRNDILNGSNLLPDSSRRKVASVNVSFLCNEDELETSERCNNGKIDRFLNERKTKAHTSTTRSCTVLIPGLPNLPDCVPSLDSKKKRRMTRREAQLKAKSVNCSKIALENQSESDQSDYDSSLSEGIKRSSRRASKKVNYQISVTEDSTSNEDLLPQKTTAYKTGISTPFIRLKRLNVADISSYKITPLKEDRIPKKSKTADDYGIDDINTDESTDDEDFPKKCIPPWAKDYKNLPRYQSYVNPNLIFDWMKPPLFSCSLRTVFFSNKSHTYM